MPHLMGSHRRGLANEEERIGLGRHDPAVLDQHNPRLLTRTSNVSGGFDSTSESQTLSTTTANPTDPLNEERYSSSSHYVQLISKSDNGISASIELPFSPHDPQSEVRRSEEQRERRFTSISSVVELTESHENNNQSARSIADSLGLDTESPVAMDSSVVHILPQSIVEPHETSEPAGYTVADNHSPADKSTGPETGTAAERDPNSSTASPTSILGHLDAITQPYTSPEQRSGVVIAPRIWTGDGRSRQLDITLPSENEWESKRCQPVSCEAISVCDEPCNAASPSFSSSSEQQNEFQGESIDFTIMTPQAQYSAP